MPVSLDDKLVVGIASSALFDTTESHCIFTERGVDAYKKHQKDNRDVPFKKGAAYPFIERLLAINNKEIGFEPIEVILLSRNDASSGYRVMNSIEHYGLGISRAAFNCGRSPFVYNVSFKTVLYLSTDTKDVRKAVVHNIPGGLVMGKYQKYDDDDTELRIAFDFDGIIVDDSAEQLYGRQGLKVFLQHENAKKDEPLGEGPLANLLKKIAYVQEQVKEKAKKQEDYKRRIRTAIITARNAPAHKRVIATLEAWGIEVDEIFFLGGISKEEIIKQYKPHMFFDDQEGWIDSASSLTAAVHVPFGVLNQQITEEFLEDEPKIFTKTGTS